MTDLDPTCINTLRFLAVDMVEEAKSGHPGLPLGAAPMAYVLWDRHLRHNPADPAWPNRDRFVLSAGHGSALLYALLHTTGYDLPIEEIRRFRQWGSRTPGHPEHGHTPGVEATTGPLGQGFAMGVGMAIAERQLRSTLNRDGFPLIDHFTYGLVSDGDLMEGIASEAASLAGMLGLGRLIYLYDDNHISLEGPTDWAFTENVPSRFEAYGWHVPRVADGNDLAAIDAAIQEAKSESTRPSLICVRTHIGYGSPVQDTREAHGEPLGPANTKLTKEKLGWPLEPTYLIPDEAGAHLRAAVARGAQWQSEWESMRGAFATAHPDAASAAFSQLAGELPAGWEAALPSYRSADGPVATRDASQKALAVLAPRLPGLVGGAADLSPSTKTVLPKTPDFSAVEGAGRNFHFGVREHAMVGMLNGLALHGGLLPYGGTFLVFSDYARGAIRLAALQQTHVVFVFTHDSIGMGEDGPTHQPVEHLVSLRAIPGLTVLRPADANETSVAWGHAVRHAGPTALILTRQKVPVLDAAVRPRGEGAERGGYVLAEATGGPPEAILIATGSEVALALDAQVRLASRGTRTRVVSLPSWELFDAQPADYRESVLPAGIPKVSVEAGRTIGWERYVGASGASIGLDRFGASAPGPVVQRELGFTVEHLVEVVDRIRTPGGGDAR
ncbi:MAG TPA: transketolase [Thermoplasmata archaeon]|jgi:transketolase|nr:transketolase [Thermoplasmata archaeon]